MGAKPSQPKSIATEKGRMDSKDALVTSILSASPASQKSEAKSRASVGRKPPKAAAKIANLLRRQIITGQLRPGERLLPERVLQEQFDVSRPTLREAMRLLEAESLIKIARGQHGGARVQKLNISVTARQVGMYLQMEGTTLADVLQARAFLEPPAARLIAVERSLAVIEALRDNLRVAKEAYEAADPVRVAQTQTDFSETLTSHARNKTLSVFAKLLHDIIYMQMVDLTVKTYSNEPALKMQWLNIRAREKLVDLITEGKADEAEKHWRSHLESAANALLSSYQALSPIDVLKEFDASI